MDIDLKFHVLVTESCSQSMQDILQYCIRCCIDISNALTQKAVASFHLILDDPNVKVSHERQRATSIP